MITPGSGLSAPGSRPRRYPTKEPVTLLDSYSYMLQLAQEEMVMVAETDFVGSSAEVAVTVTI
jgi:hypothetical protein